MTGTLTSPVTISSKEDAFPSAAIVVLALGGYMLLFVIGLIVRQCIVTKGGSCCPLWCTDSGCCANSNSIDGGCLTQCAQACNFQLPYKQQCMDYFLPSKKWCNETFCGCKDANQTEFCRCDDCTCGDCGDFGDCCDCKDCCGDCKCDCCSQNDTIDCCCIEVKLAGNRQQSGSGYPNPYGGGYINPHGPYSNNPGGYFGVEGYGGQGGLIQQQPGFFPGPPQLFNQNHAKDFSFNYGGPQSAHLAQPNIAMQNIDNMRHLPTTSMSARYTNSSKPFVA